MKRVVVDLALVIIGAISGVIAFISLVSRLCVRLDMADQVKSVIVSFIDCLFFGSRQRPDYRPYRRSYKTWYTEDSPRKINE